VAPAFEARVLTDSDKAKYARQILLTELGVAGQERLGATRVVLASDADPRAAEVAGAYLERAGVGAHAQGVEQTLRVAPAERVAQLAGDPALEDCAAWLLGAFAAVEAIKSASGVGTPATCATLGDDFVLCREVG
jgi:hypothetical protein